MAEIAAVVDAADSTLAQLQAARQKCGSRRCQIQDHIANPAGKLKFDEMSALAERLTQRIDAKKQAAVEALGQIDSDMDRIAALANNAKRAAKVAGDGTTRQWLRQ